MEEIDKNTITGNVNEFYNEMLFNHSETAMTFANDLRRFNPEEIDYS